MAVGKAGGNSLPYQGPLPSFPSTPSAAPKASSGIGKVGNFLLGLASGGLNFLYSNWQQKKQNEYNEAQLEKMNNYNSFNAIKNRLIAAGVPEKAALNAIAGSPTASQQSAMVSSAEPTQTSPAGDIAAGASSAFQNALVDEQTVNQDIQNQSQHKMNELLIQDAQMRILGLRTDLNFQKAIRRLEVANLDLQNLFGLAEYCQVQIDLLQDPRVVSSQFWNKIQKQGMYTFHPPIDLQLDGDYYEYSGEQHPKALNALLDARAKNLISFQDEVYNQMVAKGLERARLDAQKTGIEKEISNYLLSLNTNGKILLAQGAIAEMQRVTAETGLERSHALRRLADIMSMFGPLMGALLQGTQMYNNISTGVSRNRIASNTRNWQFNGATTSFSW